MKKKGGVAVLQKLQGDIANVGTCSCCDDEAAKLKTSTQNARSEWRRLLPSRDFCYGYLAAWAGLLVMLYLTRGN